MEREPTTLQEAIQYFSDPEKCLGYVVSRRWPNGVTCPTCGSQKVTFLAKQQRWQCRTKHTKRQFSVKVGTIFEDSALGLDKWLAAMWLLVNCKNGISSYEVARDLGITQKSAWHMVHRIRLAVQAGSIQKLSGEVEADETFIGGKARNMHIEKRRRRITGRGGKDKTVVLGILERGGEVRTAVVPNRKKAILQKEVKQQVRAGSALYTDELLSYDGLASEYAHQVINYAVAYVDGKIHTNGMENFWSLLKRGINGTYVSVEPFHLFRYLDEQAYRFNNRRLNDGQRFSMAVSGILGKRVTFKQLTGKAATAS
jgi:transposase-like protein